MKIIVILTLALATSRAATASGLFAKTDRSQSAGETPNPTDPRRLTLVESGPFVHPLRTHKYESPEATELMEKVAEKELEVYDNDVPPPEDAKLEACGLNPPDFWKRIPRKSVNFIHFNDVYEIRYEAFWITELRKYLKVLRNPGIVFSGDIIAPSLVTQKMVKNPGFQFRNLFRDFKIDVSVPGNHEGDKGEGNFMSFTDLNYVDPKVESTKKWSPNELADGYTDPKQEFDRKPGVWLLANLRPKNLHPGAYTKEFSPYWGNLRGATILKMNGFKFCFFGLVDENWINGSIAKAIKNNLIYDDFLVAAREYSHMLKRAGCHFVTAVTHMTNVHDRQVLEDENNVVDFVFGGHEHIFLIERKNNRVLLKSGSDFKQFSAIRFELFKDEADFKAFADAANANVREGAKPAEIVEDNTYSFVLDELNEEQMKVRHWHFPKRWEFPGKGEDGQPLQAKPEDDDLKQYTYLNVYVERVDISFADPSKRDPEYAEDFKKNYLPLIKDDMVPVFHFQGAVDAREPQIYAGEMPIGDFLTDIIKADTFADIVMLNAGSVKSEFAFPADTVLMKADAMRMLQRPSITLRSVPTVKSVNMLFDKWLEKYNEFSPDLPYFSGMKVDVITNNGKFVKSILKDEAGNPLPENKRVQFISLAFTAEVTSADQKFLDRIPEELESLKKEYLEAVIAADRERELMDYYENSLVPEGEEKPYDVMALEGDNVWEWNYATAKKIHHRNSIQSALAKAYEATASLKTLSNPNVGDFLSEDEIFIKKREVSLLAMKIFFPQSRDIYNVKLRPYDSLEKFFTLANKAFTKDYLDGFAAKALEGVTPYQLMNIWNQQPAPLDQVPQMTDDSAWPDASVLTDAPLKYEGKDDNKIKLKNLAYLRTTRDEEVRRKLNLLSLHLFYKFDRKKTDYIVLAEKDKPETKVDVEVISVNPTNMKRMTIIDEAKGANVEQRQRRKDLV